MIIATATAAKRKDDGRQHARNSPMPNEIRTIPSALLLRLLIQTPHLSAVIFIIFKR